MFSTLVTLFLGTMGACPTITAPASSKSLLQGSWTMESMQDNGDSYSPQMIQQKLAKDGRVEIGNKLIRFTSPATGQERELRVPARRVEESQGHRADQ